MARLINIVGLFNPVLFDSLCFAYAVFSFIFSRIISTVEHTSYIIQEQPLVPVLQHSLRTVVGLYRGPQVFQHGQRKHRS
jgi:hypothetical protein